MFEAGFKTFFPTTTIHQNNEEDNHSRHQMHKRTKSDNLIGESGFKKSEIISRFFNDDCDDLSEITNVFNQKRN